MATAVKELANCLMSLQRNLTYNLTNDMHIPSRPNNRNMSAKNWLISSMSGVIYGCEMENPRL